VTTIYLGDALLRRSSNQPEDSAGRLTAFCSVLLRTRFT